jgi:uncharacterized membrane protein YhaH (DUF805 family)
VLPAQFKGQSGRSEFWVAFVREKNPGFLTRRVQGMAEVVQGYFAFGTGSVIGGENVVGVAHVTIPQAVIQQPNSQEGKAFPC